MLWPPHRRKSKSGKKHHGVEIGRVDAGGQWRRSELTWERCRVDIWPAQTTNKSNFLALGMLFLPFMQVRNGLSKRFRQAGSARGFLFLLIVVIGCLYEGWHKIRTALANPQPTVMSYDAYAQSTAKCPMADVDELPTEYLPSFLLASRRQECSAL